MKQDMTITEIEAAAFCAARLIPPLWPLASSVAVNPFLGFKSRTLAEVSATHERMSGMSLLMPKEWYLEKVSAGEITDQDLLAAMAEDSQSNVPRSLEETKTARRSEGRPYPPVPTIADLASKVSGVDWLTVIVDRFGAWSGSFFDEGQALWMMAPANSAWDSWRSFASNDFTPQIHGLRSFRKGVKAADESSLSFLASAVRRLELQPAMLENYFHQMLFSLGGWAQYARYKLWEAERLGTTDKTIIDCLAIRLFWEDALYSEFKQNIDGDWQNVRSQHLISTEVSSDQAQRSLLQAAYEHSYRRRLEDKLSEECPVILKGIPQVQAVFCIDVRSEVIRRSLEAVSSKIQTLGFAGFFGLATDFRPFASDLQELRLPVLVAPALHACSKSDGELIEKQVRFSERAKRAFGRFRVAAISSFAFVEAMGPVYAFRLIRDSFSLGRHKNKEYDVALSNELGPESRTDLAEAILMAMGLSTSFAPLVLIVGHGSTVTNNPLASGLQCGACGGYSGDVNARLLVGLLNDPVVRALLKKRNIHIPGETLFIAATHDTVTEEIRLFDHELAESERRDVAGKLTPFLRAASEKARTERARRFDAANTADPCAKSRNWAEVRPEWGLAGCAAFIIAPRWRTAGKSFAGRTFLHDYAWPEDSARDFAVLEQILTAPVVVASWISLQYFGSTTAPELYGSGNKLLHNVVGGVAVLEGGTGPIRGGLAQQSLNNGTQDVHDPLRLSVYVEAPREAVTAVLAKHPDVQDLFDNEWLHLSIIDAQGNVTHRYRRKLQWQSPVEDQATTSVIIAA